MTPAAYIEAAATAALLAYAGTTGTPGTFRHESREQADLDVQADPLPFVVLFEATSNQTGPGSRVLATNVTLFFADAVPGPGDDPVAHQAAVTRMAGLKRAFFAALDAYPRAQIDGIRDTPFTGFTSSQLDGLGCQFTLTVPAPSLVVACL